MSAFPHWLSVLHALVVVLAALVAGIVVARGWWRFAPPRGRVARLVHAGRAGDGPRPGRSPPSWRWRALLLAGAAALALAVVSPPALAVAAVGVWVGPRLHAELGRRRQEATVASEVPEVVDLLGVAVVAGLTVREAVDAVARHGVGLVPRALADVVAEAGAGRQFADALDTLPARAGEPTRALAAALAGCERYGTPVGATLAVLAAEARDAERRRMEQAARRVPVLLLFPLVLCILPAFALLTVAPFLADALRALRL